MGTHCGAGLRTTRQGAHDYMPRGRGQIDGIWIAARPPLPACRSSTCLSAASRTPPAARTRRTHRPIGAMRNHIAQLCRRCHLPIVRPLARPNPKPLVHLAQPHDRAAASQRITRRTEVSNSARSSKRDRNYSSRSVSRQWPAIIRHPLFTAGRNVGRSALPASVRIDATVPRHADEVTTTPISSRPPP